MKKMFVGIIIIILFIAAMAVTEPASAWGWKTWIFSPEKEMKIEKAVEAAYGDSQVEVTFVENDCVASCVNCVTGKNEEYVQLKIFSSGYVKLTWPGANLLLAEKVRNEVQKIFTKGEMK